jgi:hypothetical protein
MGPKVKKDYVRKTGNVQIKQKIIEEERRGKKGKLWLVNMLYRSLQFPRLCTYLSLFIHYSSMFLLVLVLQYVLMKFVY